MSFYISIILAAFITHEHALGIKVTQGFNFLKHSSTELREFCDVFEMQNRISHSHILLHGLCSSKTNKNNVYSCTTFLQKKHLEFHFLCYSILLVVLWYIQFHSFIHSYYKVITPLLNIILQLENHQSRLIKKSHICSFQQQLYCDSPHPNPLFIQWWIIASFLFEQAVQFYSYFIFIF